MSDFVEKPPMGLQPLLFHNEKRFQEVIQAISRYWDANLPVPVEWVVEYNELLAYLKENKSAILCP